MMKNHGIRFQYRNSDSDWLNSKSWESLLEYAYYLTDDDMFRVHPDDVAKFDPASGDVCKGLALVEQSCILYNFVVPINKENQFRIERVDYIRERGGKEWLSPDEVRDEN